MVHPSLLSTKALIQTQGRGWHFFPQKLKERKKEKILNPTIKHHAELRKACGKGSGPIMGLCTLDRFFKLWNFKKYIYIYIKSFGYIFWNSFHFTSTYKIKVFENTHSIGLEIGTIELLNPRDIKQLRDQTYKILHIGAIQVAVKPLTRIGLNKPICVCLRDAQHNNFDDSFLGVMESNMAHSPIYFNCFPDLELSCINDMAMHKAQH